MPLEIRLRVDDLRQATKELTANRDQYSDTDLVDLVMSEDVATVRAVGTQAAIRAENDRDGSLRLPLKLLAKIGEALKDLSGHEVRLFCEDGTIKVGARVFRHQGIEVDRAPLTDLGLPVNLSLLDTLALTKIITRKEIDQAGMQSRVDEAEYSRRRAIAAAIEALKELEIDERQLSELVESQVRVAAKRLGKSLQAA
jgi:hypothetical protein